MVYLTTFVVVCSSYAFGSCVSASIFHFIVDLLLLQQNESIGGEGKREASIGNEGEDHLRERR